MSATSSTGRLIRQAAPAPTGEAVRGCRAGSAQTANGASKGARRSWCPADRRGRAGFESQEVPPHRRTCAWQSCADYAACGIVPLCRVPDYAEWRPQSAHRGFVWRLRFGIVYWSGHAGKVEKPFVVLNTIAGARIGPLADHLNAYLSLVRGQGYAPGSARIQVQVIASFSQWLGRKGMEVRDLDENVVERFLQGHRDARSASRGDAGTLKRLLRMLRQNGVTQEERRAAPSRQERLTEEYRRYLLQDRGLSQATAVNYLPFIDQFLSERFVGAG